MTMGPVLKCLRHWADLERREVPAFAFRQVLTSNGDPLPAYPRRTLLEMPLDDEETDDSDSDRAARHKRLQATRVPTKVPAPRVHGKAAQVGYTEVSSEDDQPKHGKGKEKAHTRKPIKPPSRTRPVAIPIPSRQAAHPLPFTSHSAMWTDPGSSSSAVPMIPLATAHAMQYVIDPDLLMGGQSHGAYMPCHDGHDSPDADGPEKDSLPMFSTTTGLAALASKPIRSAVSRLPTIPEGGIHTPMQGRRQGSATPRACPISRDPIATRSTSKPPPGRTRSQDMTPAPSKKRKAPPLENERPARRVGRPRKA